jgi:hypothetical protein
LVPTATKNSKRRRETLTGERKAESGSGKKTKKSRTVGEVRPLPVTTLSWYNKLTESPNWPSGTPQEVGEYLDKLFEFTKAELILREEKRAREGGRIDSTRLTSANYNRPKFDKWVAAIILVGVAKVPSVKAAYTKGDPAYLRHLRGVCSRNHFEVINSLVTAVTHTESRFYDLLHALESSCATKWTPTESISVDETLIKFLGWFRHHYGLQRKKAKNGAKIFGLVDSMGWFAAWALCKRKTLDGGRMDPISIQDSIFWLIDRQPRTKTYHLCTDAWFTNEPMVMALVNTGFIQLTGSCASNKFSPIWRVGCCCFTVPSTEVTLQQKLDTEFAECRSRNPSHMFSVGRGKLLTGQSFWAVSCKNPRKGGKHLRYISTHVDGQMAVRAVKTDMNDEYRREKRERVLSAVKDVYDRGFSNEDENDKAAAYIKPTIRNRNWERAVIMGIFFVLLAANCRLLYDGAVPESETPMTTREFAAAIAYALGGYDPYATHTSTSTSYDSCAVCRWWKKHRARDGGAKFIARKTNTKCARCKIRICSNCWLHRHYVHFATLGK